MSTERAGLLGRLADRVEAVRVGHPVRVALDGPDAAGKTVLADELAAVLRGRGREVVRASVDDFARPRAERYARGPASPEGYYRDAVDQESLLGLLLDPLGPGGDRVIRVGCFDAAHDRPWHPPPMRAAKDAILLCDGIFLLRPELRDRWDLRMVVTAAFDVRLRRALIRDVPRLGSVDVVEHRYRTRYEPGQELYRAEAQPEAVADVIVHNDDPAAPLLRTARA